MLASEGVVYPFFTNLLFSDALDVDFFEPDTPYSELVNQASTVTFFCWSQRRSRAELTKDKLTSDD